MVIAYIISITGGPTLFPGGLLAWLFVGLIAGFLASAAIRGRGYGCIGNIIVGLVGAVIGGYLASLLDIQDGRTGNLPQNTLHTFFFFTHFPPVFPELICFPLVIDGLLPYTIDIDFMII